MNTETIEEDSRKVTEVGKELLRKLIEELGNEIPDFSALFEPHAFDSVLEIP